MILLSRSVNNYLQNLTLIYALTIDIDILCHSIDIISMAIDNREPRARARARVRQNGRGFR